ncbi:helix-turn-helix domain-containing protein [Micromonospora deserti]|uniref:HTH iclR-type domain-containing protein n=1 Tax=Micromonospora deserti TaxID=2070366 RepID=A0A2W2EDW4_9ACTN|nr:helix-turn-helix domain-containing protein [Micromonospora deserti]PZG02944.1 hypothetical protein C1I99_00325 [Micromonospora deserti]
MAPEMGSGHRVNRAFSAHHAITAGRTELRGSDVAQLAGPSLATTCRLLATLEAAGFVDREPEFVGEYAAAGALGVGSAMRKAPLVSVVATLATLALVPCPGCPSRATPAASTCSISSTL